MTAVEESAGCVPHQRAATARGFVQSVRLIVQGVSVEAMAAGGFAEAVKMASTVTTVTSVCRRRQAVVEAVVAQPEMKKELICQLFSYWGFFGPEEG